MMKNLLNTVALLICGLFFTFSLYGIPSPLPPGTVAKGVQPAETNGKKVTYPSIKISNISKEPMELRVAGRRQADGRFGNGKRYFP